jgi:translin
LDVGREGAYVLSRQVVRVASESIKTAHRRDFDQARQLLAECRELSLKMVDALADCIELRYGGFVADAQKEYAEAAITIAGVTDSELPTPQELEVEGAVWLNGMAEAVGEFRRHVLDCIRTGDIERAERFLDLMDDIYHLVMGFDYPNAISLGLRGRSDACRGFVERTRGEVTTALRQKRLEERLEQMEKQIGEG